MMSRQKQYPQAQAKLLGCSMLLLLMAPLVLHMPGRWSPACPLRLPTLQARAWAACGP